MGASLDEFSYNYSLDAPAGVSTNFYVLIGDNAYGYSSSANDFDCYAIHLNAGMNYSILSVDGGTPSGVSGTPSTNFFILDRYGSILTNLGSIDYGAIVA